MTVPNSEVQALYWYLIRKAGVSVWAGYVTLTGWLINGLSNPDRALFMFGYPCSFNNPSPVPYFKPLLESVGFTITNDLGYRYEGDGEGYWKVHIEMCREKLEAGYREYLEAQYFNQFIGLSGEDYPGLFEQFN